MNLDIIDLPALVAAVDAALAAAPAELQPWCAQLRKPLCRDLLAKEKPAIARRRKSDPQWAQRAFNRKARLYRLGDDRLSDLAHDLKALTLGLAGIARMNADRSHPMQAGAGQFLRALRHWQPEYFASVRFCWDYRTQMGSLIEEFECRADRAWCRMRRHERFAAPRRNPERPLSPPRGF